MSKLLSNSISSKACWFVNRAITFFLNDHLAALLLADLVSRRDRFTHQLDIDGGFFAISEEIEVELCIGKKARLRATKILVDAGLLTVKMKPQLVPEKGYQTVNFFYINDIKVAEILSYENVNDVKGRFLLDRRGVPNDTTTDTYYLSKKNSDQDLETENTSGSQLKNKELNESHGPSYPNTRATNSKAASLETLNPGRPSLHDITNTWQADNTDFAQNVLTKIDLFSELFQQIRAHGYTFEEAKSFKKTLENILAPNRKNKEWCRNVEKAIHLGCAAVYPVKTTAVQKYQQGMAAGTTLAHEVPHEAKSFEKKPIHIVDIDEVFGE